MENKVRYNWATLGTGVIANELAQALEKLGGSFIRLLIEHIKKAWSLHKNTVLKKSTTR